MGQTTSNRDGSNEAYLSGRGLNNSAFAFPHRIEVLVCAIFFAFRVNIENLSHVYGQHNVDLEKCIKELTTHLDDVSDEIRQDLVLLDLLAVIPNLLLHRLLLVC